VEYATFRLVVGLGNPGREYAETRHNVGFLVLDELARRAGIPFHREAKWNAETARPGDWLLMKPLTFMNLSGEAVAGCARYLRIEPQDVLVVLDDAALPLGGLRLRRSGSAGGHNGLSSVISHLGTDAIPRLRVGIGDGGDSLHDHVLGRFRAEERPDLEATLQRAADAVTHAITRGFESAMNLYNQKATQ